MLSVAVRGGPAARIEREGMAAMRPVHRPHWLALAAALISFATSAPPHYKAKGLGADLRASSQIQIDDDEEREILPMSVEEDASSDDDDDDGKA